MSLKETMRARILELRVRERELIEQREAIEAELVENAAEQVRAKRLLIDDAKTTIGMQVATKQSARGTVARLGGFVMSELEAELGWDRPRVKQLLEAMMSAKPPSVVQEGKLGTRPFFRYVGPSIEQAEVQEREAADLEAVREWALVQTTAFTPYECAAAAQVGRASALRHLRKMVELGVLTDVGPTLDMPIFQITGEQGPDLAIDRPDLHAVPEPEPLSKIPQIQELLAAAQVAKCDITPSNGHFRIETLDGRSVIIKAKPEGRAQLLRDKAALRRIGVRV